MRRDGIPYVQNPKSYYPPIDITKLSLEELKQKYLKHCGKSNGDVSVCSKCKTPCSEGKRAIQLIANDVYNDPPVPLYAGKTMIERAKEDNMRKRAEAAAKEANVLKAEPEHKEAVSDKPKKRKYQKMDDWWEKSLQAEDQVEWLVAEFNISKTQAKKKIYSYKWNHGLAGTSAKVETSTTITQKEAEPVETKEETKPTRNPNDVVFLTMESKIDDLMKLQADYKKKADEYTTKYKEITEQIDILCKAMDVFDKT